MEKNEAIRTAQNFDKILDIQYGKIGTAVRNEFQKMHNPLLSMNY